MPESNSASLAGKLKRYSQVSTSVTGVAAKLVGRNFFGMDLDEEQHAHDLKMALGGLKGPLMKVAQLLSTIPDAMPAAYTRELSQLQSQAPAMGWLFVKRRMKSELGENWQNLFLEFSNNALAAASLGQVHKAKTLQGDDVACKLQYPDMESVVEADLNQLKLLLTMFEKYDKAVHSSEAHEEIAARLREELDYSLEANNIKMFAKMLDGFPTIHVPEVYDDLSTKRLLSMSWLEGSELLTVKDKSIEIRNQVARNMFYAWYVPFYHYGVIHGDPHMGNYTVKGNGDINLLDFGCIRIFPETFVQGVIDLYFALLNNDKDLAVCAYQSWGFKDLRNEVIDVLNIWAKFLYGPILDDRTRPIEDRASGIYGRDVAARFHEELRRIGGIKPPREFIFMDRAAIGLGSVFMHLQAELNWHNEFHSLIENFNMSDLRKRQNQLQNKTQDLPAAS